VARSMLVFPLFGIFSLLPFFSFFLTVKNKLRKGATITSLFPGSLSLLLLFLLSPFPCFLHEKPLAARI